MGINIYCEGDGKFKKKYIDFITIDGAEGGTGAAPAEFTDHLGSP